MRAPLVAVCCVVASVAKAHAPQARAVALTPDGAAIAIALPGFGLLVRRQASSSFAYFCDAALDVQPTDAVSTLAYLLDGTLLVGTPSGIRRVARSGCPTNEVVGPLASATVVALAVHVETNIVYAATAGDLPALWRSEDGGQTWRKRSTLAGAEQVTALHVSADQSETLYISRGRTGASTLLVSTDGGASFAPVEQARVLTLLHVPSAATERFWAVAPSADHAGNRGFDVLRGDALAGPWVKVLRVEYFGGFMIDARGAVWVGDEGGGVHRSVDEGEVFTDVGPDQAVACLAAAGDAVWACAPGTPLEPALLRQPESAGVFTPVVTFADVDHLAECDAELEVPKRCAAAWGEWRRDVRMEGSAAEDAGVDAAQKSERVRDGDAGCSVVPRRRRVRASWTLVVLFVGVCVSLRRRRPSRRLP